MAIWRNTTVVGLLEVTDQYLVSDHNYNLAKVDTFDTVDCVELSDDRTSTRIVGDNIETRASNGYITIHTSNNGNINITNDADGNITARSSRGDITLSIPTASRDLFLDTTHLVLTEHNGFTWGVNNPTVNAETKVGQIYFKVIP